VVVKAMADFTLQVQRGLWSTVPIEIPRRDGGTPPSLSPNRIDGRLDLCKVKIGAAWIASDRVEVLSQNKK